tara:strand:+ start:27308 stop:28051 length:744 start_codon:yes stop_codon:yes gene_type:complete
VKYLTLGNTILLFFIPIELLSQTLTIRNKISNEPLVGVNVYSTNHGTTTDTNGVCRIDGFIDDEITISHIGYKIITRNKNRLPETIFLSMINIPADNIHVLGLKSKKDRKRFYKLERDVIRVYPYAQLVGILLKEYSTMLDSINGLWYLRRKNAKKKIFQKIEKQLIKTYGEKVQRLTKSQGRILIRLIDRETGNTSHRIIKDFRGFLSAGFWQITARLFGHNLKSSYNPEKGEDKMIEHIINKLKK